MLCIWKHKSFPGKISVQVLLSEKELTKLPDDSPNILKKSNNDSYMEKPCATFYKKKIVLNGVLRAVFSY